MSTIPSIAMIPSGYKANKVYSVLPTDGAADLTFARTSSANRVNSNNLIEEVATGVPRLDYTDGTCPSLLLEPQSTNLITYPLSFGSNYWTKSGASIEGDSSTAGVEKVTNGDFATDSDWSKGTGWTISGGNASVDTASTVGLSQAISAVSGSIYTVVVEMSNYTSGSLQLQFGSQIIDTESANGKYVYTVTSTTTNPTFYLYAVGDSEFSIDDVSVKEVQGFSAPSVDNPTSAFKLVATANNALLNKTPTGTSGIDYTNSIYVKRVSGSGDVFLRNVNNTNILLDLSTEWKRFDASIISTSTFSRFTIEIATIGDEIMVFGAQQEQLSHSTSLMLPAVEGSTVTRVAETASKTGLASYINSEEGVLYAEISALFDDGKNKYITISDGGTQNAIRFYFSSTSKQIVARYYVGNAVKANLYYILSDSTIFNKIAFKFKVNDFALWVNGNEVQTDLDGNVNPSNTFNRIDFNLGGNNYFEGNVKDLRIYKTALSDSELVTLTTI